MSPLAVLQPVALLLAVMAGLALIELVIPLRRRTAWSRGHLGPNLALTLITIATSLVLNVGLVLALAWSQRQGVGLFNLLRLPLWVTLVGGVVVLDLAWYVTHRTMHQVPALWRFHAVHHSDPMVDVTTTIRQHPVEGLFRYAFLLLFGLAFGVSPAAFVVYRSWSVFQGQFDHANIRLPAWLDEAISWISASPNMHKVHHSRNPALTNTNYSSIVSAWDRLFGTFTPASRGVAVDYGLDGHDQAGRQSLADLIHSPFEALPLRPA